MGERGQLICYDCSIPPTPRTRLCRYYCVLLTLVKDCRQNTLRTTHISTLHTYLVINCRIRVLAAVINFSFLSSSSTAGAAAAAPAAAAKAAAPVEEEVDALDGESNF